MIRIFLSKYKLKECLKSGKDETSNYAADVMGQTAGMNLALLCTTVTNEDNFLSLA